MSTILFDLIATQPNSAGKRHGGGKYGEVVFKRMIGLKIPMICFYNSELWLNPEIKQIVESNSIKLFDLSKTSLNEIISQNGISLVYSALMSQYLMTIKECKVVVTIHGLRHLETPADSFSKKYRKKISFLDRVRSLKNLFQTKTDIIKKNEKYYNDILKRDNFYVVTVSNHSAASFKSYFPSLKDVQIPVYYSPSTIDKLVKGTETTDKYFLMVNGNRWMKNNLRSIIALDSLFTDGYLDGYKAIITGVKDVNIYKYKIQNSDCFIFLDYVEEDKLSQLFHDAYCLIYPSLNEGFGYPPLEAMCYGVPVISSPFSSIPEVCGGAVLYVNPFDIFEIRNRIIQISDSKLHEEMSKRSLLQYSKILERQKNDLDKLIDYIVLLSK